MKRIRRYLGGLCLVLFGLLLGFVVQLTITRDRLPLEGGGVLSPGEVEDLGRSLFSGKGDDREARGELMQYFDYDLKAHQMSQLLIKAADADDRKGVFNSPLQLYFYLIPKVRDANYTGFNAIEAFCLSNIDHTVDINTMPVGINVSGSFFYPCADTLVRLHVRRNHVLSAMGRLENVEKPRADNRAYVAALKDWEHYNRKLRLLTWVLYKTELEDVDVAELLLQREVERGKGEKENFLRAIKLLEKPRDLMPVAFEVPKQK